MQNDVAKTDLLSKQLHLTTGIAGAAEGVGGDVGAAVEHAGALDGDAEEAGDLIGPDADTFEALAEFAVGKSFALCLLDATEDFVAHAGEEIGRAHV